MLKPEKYPFDKEPYSGTSKTAAFREAARKAGMEPFFPDLAVTFAAAEGETPVPGEPIREDRPNLHSGHTHAPALSRIPRDGGRETVVINSGCWLRQLHPVPARFGGPPVYVPEFVQTHARVHLEGDEIQAELWERPRPAPRHLRATERLAALGRLPAQPAADSKPRISASANLPKGGRPA
jgi:hypothetical protein